MFCFFSVLGRTVSYLLKVESTGTFLVLTHLLSYPVSCTSLQIGLWNLFKELLLSLGTHGHPRFFRQRVQKYGDFLNRARLWLKKFEKICVFLLLRGIAEAFPCGLQSAGDSFEGVFAHESLLVFPSALPARNVSTLIPINCLVHSEQFVNNSCSRKQFVFPKQNKSRLDEPIHEDSWRGKRKERAEKTNNFERFFGDSTLTFLTFRNTYRLLILPTRRAVLLRRREIKIRRREILIC